jgi:signal transduction histidine kinase
MDYKARDDYDIWVADPLGVPSQVTIPYFDSVYYNSFNEAKEKGEDFFATNLSFEEKNRFYQKLFEYVPGLPEEAKKFYFSCPGLAASTVLLENVCLYIENFSGTPYSDEENATLMRFGKVFQQTYTRFLDLQKAEAQAREAKIETALEKVRSRTMAMQKSGELGDVATVLFKELNQLVENLWTCGFVLCEMGRAEDEWWLSTSDGFIPAFYLPNTGDATHANIYDVWKKGETYHTEQLEGQALQEHYDWLMNIPVSRKIFEDMFAAGFSLPTWQKLHCAYFSYGYLVMITQVHCSEDQIFKRFAQVFDQTYTRFLDLQKAEAQARESQIQLALERVRARTMAMQRSEELKDAANLLFQQVKSLGVPALTCGYNIWDKEENVCTAWMSSEDGLILPSFQIPLTETPTFIRFYQSRQKEESFYVEEVSGEALKEHYSYMHTLPVFREILDKFLEAGFTLPSFQINHVANFSHGNLIFISYLPVPEAHDIFKRFGKVFEQTYTRFLDLQKAEAQAREAKIEAALEKVRSRSMAMHKSDEVLDVADTLYKELRNLDFPFGACTIVIMDKTSGDMEHWVAGFSQRSYPESYPIKYFNHPIHDAQLNLWKNGEKFAVLEMTGEIKQSYTEWVLNQTGYKNFPEEEKKWMRAAESAHFSMAYMAHGALMWAPERITDEFALILQRFSKVFEQTYTRFLDLQKAEAQAREAKIEVALEKVRSRTMAMQRSEELLDVASILFQQVKALGVPQWNCGFNIWDIGDKEFTYYPGSPDGRILPTPCKIPLTEHPVFMRFDESRKRGDELLIYEKQGEQQTDHYRYMLSLPGVGDLLRNMLDAGFQLPTFQIDHVANFSYGNLIFITYEHFPEMHNVFKRFAKVFEQTYTRFLDLQKAEAQAREAVKQASVDRVRAEIASMRTTGDLERITPLIWNELKTLGVPFIRCGIFIIDEEQQQVHAFLSTPDGKANASFTSAFSTVSIITEALPYWRRKEIYKAHWDEATFIEQTKHLVEQGAVSSTNTYLTENRPKNLYLHLLPFLQGILYVGNESPLNDDELQLVQDLADAFAIAYARYEDFNKLELAKEQIEKTLVDLKQTQAQLVQSEKMASLGELTAGIAHEIQNPLNFVNNFSEVSTELLDEMITELGNGNKEDAITIADDVKQNLEKILHHGKRADGIVKGMLQHSRSSSATKEPTDINKLADEYLRLAYHGLRAKDKSFNATMKTDFDESLGNINIIPQDIGRVILNLINNAFYAAFLPPPDGGGFKDPDYKHEPAIWVGTKKIGDKVLISVRDNGPGIPPKVLDKIFQPFFTTKPTGQGTGLGLSLSYDIVKAHGGELKVETKEGEGAEFIIQLPV